jgi:hypothetical protein
VQVQALVIPETAADRTTTAYVAHKLTTVTSTEDAAQQCAALEQTDYSADTTPTKTHDFYVYQFSGSWYCATDGYETSPTDCSTAPAAVFTYVS